MKKTIVFLVFMLLVTVLFAARTRAYTQALAALGSELSLLQFPGVTCTSTQTAPGYVVSAYVTSRPTEVISTATHLPSQIRLYRFGNGTTVPYNTRTFMQFSPFATDWTGGETLRVTIINNNVSPSRTGSWDFVIPDNLTSALTITTQILMDLWGPSVPSFATNPIPTNNSTNDIVNGQPFSLSWNSVAGATGYKLYWNNATEYVDLAENNWTTPTMATGNYTWQVVPYNELGDAINCPVWQFSVSVIELNPATNPSPGDNSTFAWTENQTKLLTWSAPSTGESPTGYKIVFNNDIPIDVGLSYSWQTPTLERCENTWQVLPYYYNLVAVNCPVWSFTMQAPLLDFTADTDFGDVWVNHQVSRTYHMNNIGNIPMIVNLLFTPGVFTITPLPGTYEIAAGSSMEITVNFLPIALQSYNRNLYIETDDPLQPFLIQSLSGVGYNLVSSFTADPMSGLIPLPVNFSALVQNAHANYLWDFGDGEIANGQDSSVNHVYSAAMQYQVTLTVTDNWGFTISSLLSINAISWADLSVSQDELQFPDAYLMDSEIRTLSIINLGPGVLDVQSVFLKNNNPAFSIGNLNNLGLLNPNESIEISVNFSPLQVGVISDSLIVVSDAANSPRKAIKLSGTGKYVPPMTPENISITIDNTDALIQWNAVTQSIYGSPLTIPYYFIYGAKTPGAGEEEQFFLGYSTGTSFRHLGVNLPGSNIQPPRQYFYTVSAVIWYPARNMDIDLESLAGKINRKDMQTLMNR